MLQVEDFLEEMEASEELMEREKDGRYIAVAIVFGLFGFEEIGWKLKRLEVGKLFGRWMFGFEDLLIV